jgi:ribosomal protein S18 acetylase RimI-like enzyme
LHADSWRRFYRGAYSDEFLDGDVRADRQLVWSARLSQPSIATRTLVATTSDEGIVGFVHVVLDEDSTWGSLVDNIHVEERYQRTGIGSQLIAIAAEIVADSATASGLYLWVLEQNTSAQAFYQRHGATCAEKTPVQPPNGVQTRLNGSPMKLRYVWADARNVYRRSASLTRRPR